MQTNLYLFVLECRAQTCLTEMLELGFGPTLNLLFNIYLLIQNEEFPINGGSAIMTFSVEDRGKPEAIEFLWKK